MKQQFLILGAGIFGLCTAIALRKKGHSVSLINPGTIPHPLAASTDISKIIRMEYGSDTEYLQMARKSMDTWRRWNTTLGTTVYHETGFLLATSSPMTTAERPYETASYEQIIRHQFRPERMSPTSFKKRYPALNSEHFIDGFYHKIAGYAVSGKAIQALATYARQIGIQIRTATEAKKILITNKRASGITTTSGERIKADEIIVCAGNHTPYLIPDLHPYFKVTGHPVFHLQPADPTLFTYPNFTVFAADIADTGWYGFPFHPTEKVVKIARHSNGLILNPLSNERIVYDSDIQQLRSFLETAIPSLAKAPISYSRRCCYTDTLDGHFWIDRHPDIDGLTIGSGGSGHGFKMGPVVGEMIAAKALRQSHNWSDRYDWRELTSDTQPQEEARYLTKDS